MTYKSAGASVLDGIGDGLHPAVDGMLLRYFPELQEGWLVAVGLGPDVRIGFFSHYCGDAAAWCVAAPGEVVTTHRDGKWIRTGGTSIVAPYIAGALAALKSIYPDLPLPPDSRLPACSRRQTGARRMMWGITRNSNPGSE